jgi:hypothetical protein
MPESTGEPVSIVLEVERKDWGEPGQKNDLPPSGPGTSMATNDDFF